MQQDRFYLIPTKGEAKISASYGDLQFNSDTLTLVPFKDIPNENQTSLTIDKDKVKSDGADFATISLYAVNNAGDKIVDGSNFDLIVVDSSGHKIINGKDVQWTKFTSKDDVLLSTIKSTVPGKVTIYLSY